MNTIQQLRTLLTITAILAILVVGLGAYTRLTNAGLGCPDWPGCYGQISVPASHQALSTAHSLYPHQPVEAGKAWREMIHRYAAGSLVLLVVVSLALTLRARRQGARVSIALPLFLCAWIGFQALLGMWTVTWKLLPIVVTGHLLSGAILFCGLVLFRFHVSETASQGLSAWRVWFGIGAALVFIQMALGGWVSSNYAGVVCTGFPRCNGMWWPVHLETLKHAFQLFGQSHDVSYLGGVLTHDVRVVIQVVHRFGAYCVLVYSLGLLGLLWRKRASIPRENALFWMRMAGVVLGLLGMQMSLGIINVVYVLPLPVAVMHNVVAVLLFSAWSVMCWQK